MKKSKSINTLKNLNDVIEFLSLDNKDILARMKRKKKFIKKWIEKYLDNFPDIGFTNIPAFYGRSGYPDWANSLLELCEKVCLECKYYKDNKCDDDNELKDCLNQYDGFIELHTRGKGNVADNKIIQIKKATESTLHKGKVDRIFNPDSLVLTNIVFPNYNNAVHKQQIREANKATDILDTKNYSEGMLKKSLQTISLLSIKIKGDPETYSDKIKTIIKSFFCKDLSLDFRVNLELFSVIVSLFYIFFSDLLNKMILRNTPNRSEVCAKTSDYQEQNLILNAINSEDEVFFLENSKYDPNYKNTHSHIFNSEEVNIDSILKFAELIIGFLNYNSIKSISVKNLPEEIKLELDYLCKKQRLSKTKITKNGNYYTNSNDIISKEKILKYYLYEMYSKFFSFVIGVCDTDLRKRRPTIPEEVLKSVCVLLQKGETLTKIAKDNNIKYGKLSEFIGKNIKLHNEWEFQTEQYKRNLKIIIHSTKEENEKWIAKCVK